MGADTAMSVASEMVEDLSLSHDDARAIAAAIKQEIKQLTGQAPMFSVVDRSVHTAIQQCNFVTLLCQTMNTTSVQPAVTAQAATCVTICCIASCLSLAF